MRISRHAFIALVAAVPAAAKMFPRIDLEQASDNPTTIIEIPSCFAEIGPNHFSTSRRTIDGPCRIYDFISSVGGTPTDASRKLAIMRDNGATLMQWAQNDRAIFRWCSGPGNELVVPVGSTIRLLQLEYDHYSKTAEEAEPDWITWTTLERPNEEGKYVISKTIPGAFDHFEYGDDGDWGDK